MNAKAREADQSREAEFACHWERLTDLAEHVFRKGFDKGQVLGKAGHEIRGLACYLLDPGHLLVLAGDKLGSWYAGTFDPVSGVPANLPWHELPSVHCGNDRHVIDVLKIVFWQSEPAVVVGSRGGGACLAPLAAVSQPGWQGEGLVRLQEGEGTPIRRLLFDPATQTLWAAAGTELLVWSLTEATPRLVYRESLGFRVTALAIDHGDGGFSDDQLYIATNRCCLFRFNRLADRSFRVTAAMLEPKGALWQGRASVMEWLEPLSSIRCFDKATGRWARRYRERGVFGATLRHLVLVCDDPSGRPHPLSETRIATLQSKILDLASVSLGSWQCLMASTLEGTVRIFRPSGVRKPETNELAPYAEGVPENASPISLVSGFEDAAFPQRVYGIALPLQDSPPENLFLPVILGLGDHTVRFFNYTVRWEVRRQTREESRSLVDSFPVDELLDQLQQKALSPDQSRRDKNGLIQILPEIGPLCQTEQQWRRLRLLIWDGLAHLEDRGIPHSMIQALRRLQALCPERREDLEDMITTIRKYVLDLRSFSEKETDYLKLVHSSDPSLEDDRVIYRSILCSRRHDPVFQRNFNPSDQFGEVQVFAAIPQQGPDGARRPFDSVAPENMRFLVMTYRRTIWLLDGSGRALRLHGNESSWGHAQAIHFWKDEVLLSFSQSGIYQAPRMDLLAPWEEIAESPSLRLRPLPLQASSIRALCFCEVPGGGERDERFFWGDGEGKIFLATAEGSHHLADLGAEDALRGGALPEIQDLRSFVIRTPDGSDIALVAACTSQGSLHLLRWSERRVLKQVAEARIGNTRATSLLITESSPRQIVVSGLDGIVVGYWVVPRENAPEDRPVDLHVYWAYRAEQAVQTLQPLHPTKAISPELPLIVAGSYDEHLHVLDVFGRHLEIVYLPKMKIDRFVTGLALKGDSDLTEGRVYACAFENQFRVLRVVSRRRLLKGMDKELWALGEDEREERLSRWRAYALKEGHLRHRFARQSRRYPGPRVQDALTEIRRLLEAGDNSERTTGLVTALLRRLFQNHFPGREIKMGEPPGGLREVLDDSSLYLGVIRLVRQLEEQWNTPGSLENRRVQLFWIRSFLRNIEDLAMLRRWVDFGTAVSAEEPLAAADELLHHFLEHLPDLLQLKTLQYVERLLLGWTGIDGNGILQRGEAISSSDLNWLLDALLRWLRTHRSQIHADQPHPVVLQIGRLFGSLINEGHLDPLYLSHRLQNEEVLGEGEMDEILIGQCAAMASLPISKSWSKEKADRMMQAASMLTKSRHLEIQLDPRHSVTALVSTMKEILAHTRQSSSSSVFVVDVGLYFRNLIPLLQVQNLEDLKNLAQSWKPEPGPCLSFSSYEELKGLTLVLERVARYWDKKYADIYETPMRCLHYEDFHAIRTAWRLVNESFQGSRNRFSRQEQRIFSRVINQWEQIIHEEQNKYLLQDLFQIVEGFLGEIPKASMNAVEAMARVAEDEELTFTAFSNLFTRLLLFSEPTRALFIYRGVENRTVGSRVFVQSDDPDQYELIEGNLQGRPFEIPPEWSTWEEFERLEIEKIETWLTRDEPTLTWRVVPIPIASEAASHFGFYVFGWREVPESGLQRFEMHRLTWVLLLQALSFRQASVSQDSMKGRMFSIVAHNLAAPVFKMRSDLGVLLKGFFEDQPTSRKEKYLELVRQARHMTGIIDGILSLSSRETGVAFDNVALASVIYEVVRTLRKDAQGKRIEIVFAKPSHDDEIASLFWTDEVKIYDILLNLLGNAIKYSPAGSRVVVDFQIQRKGAEIKVRDEGPGIPRNELALVFDPFFRGNIPTVQGIQGLGLGLYVSQLYAKKLSGRIRVANNSDRGATFTVYLPRQNGGATKGDDA